MAMSEHVEDIVKHWDGSKFTTFAYGRECDPAVKGLCWFQSYDKKVDVLAAVLVFPGHEDKPLVRLRMEKDGRKKITDIYPKLRRQKADLIWPQEFLAQMAADFVVPDDPEAMNLALITDVESFKEWLRNLRRRPEVMYEFTWN